MDDPFSGEEFVWQPDHDDEYTPRCPKCGAVLSLVAEVPTSIEVDYSDSSSTMVYLGPDDYPDTDDLERAVRDKRAALYLICSCNNTRYQIPPHITLVLG